MQNKIKIGIDIDGVIACRLDELDYLNQYFNLDLKFEDCTNVHFEDYVPHIEGLDAEEQEYREWRKHAAAKQYGVKAVIDGAVETIQYWFDSGKYELHIITKRSERNMPISVEWFEKHGIKYHQLHFLGGKGIKSEIVNNFDIKYFIEDDLRNVKDVVENSNIKTFLLDSPYNQERVEEEFKDQVVRVFNWQEIKENI